MRAQHFLAGPRHRSSAGSGAGAGASPSTPSGRGVAARATVLLASLLSIASLFALTASAALAAPPSPLTFQPEPGATNGSATFNGFPDVGGANESGTYEFLYKQTNTPSVSECESAGASKIPEPSGAFHEAFEVVSQQVTGLTLNAEYVVCLAAANGEGERAVGNAVSFETGPEAPETGQASEVTATSAKLEGVLRPPGTKLEYDFIYNQGASCAGGSSTPFAEGEDTVSTVVSGLAPATPYTFCLVARDAHGTTTGQGVSFTTLAAPPAVLEEFTTNVSATGATLNATLNPDGLPTTYRFEYGITEAYGSIIPIPSGSAGSGNSVVTVHALVEGLAPGTTYHYRVVATNSLSPAGGTVGPDQTFTTQIAATSFLPDGRAWELVSPPDKNGSALGAFNTEGSLIQTAADGSALTYIAKAPVTSEPAGNRGFAQDQLFATRAAGGGWSTQDIATPHEGVAGVVTGELSEYRLFSPDLLSGIVEPANFTPLAPTATERTPYRREANGEYLPLVTPSNVFPPGTKFGPEESRPGEVGLGTGVEFVAASPDLSHIVLSSAHSLTEGFETGGNGALYEWAGGRLEPVSILPDGSSASLEGPTSVGQSLSLSLLGGGQQPNGLLRNAVSQDGSRVIFSLQLSGGESNELYLRDLGRKETVRLDLVQGGTGEGKEHPRFQAASVDGSRIFFTDPQALTERSASYEAGGQQGDLYECHIVEEAGHLACALTDLTPETAGEPADVQGTVVAASIDGSSVYFVADGRLSSEPGPGGELPVAGNCINVPNNEANETELATQRCNLYLRSGGRTTLVAVLSALDFPDWAPSEGQPANLKYLAARVSPNGRYLAFMSERPLTGYDNRDAASGQPDEEVFLYDDGSGRLVCASCDPSGARPTGIRDANVDAEPPQLWDGVGIWSGGRRWIAGSIPGWTPTTRGLSQYQPRYLSDQGRLFFNSPVGLSPKDSNGTQDVYEYEPPGLGGCTTAEAGFSRRAEGCIDLISSGTSGEESVFLDASESGDDVFFLTTSRLAPQDADSALDAYDAHVCTAASPCPPPTTASPPKCEGDACQQPATPPNDATPGSLTFNGPGNVKECPKGKVKKNSKCVKKQKGKKHHKKSNKKKSKKQKNNRTASHEGGGGK